MTLKLVHDDADVIPLDIYNFQDIAACARRFADQLEAGEQGEPRRVVLILDTPDGVAVSGWGESLNGFELLGLLDVAKHRAYETNIDGDE